MAQETLRLRATFEHQEKSLVAFSRLMTEFRERLRRLGFVTTVWEELGDLPPTAETYSAAPPATLTIERTEPLFDPGRHTVASLAMWLDELRLSAAELDRLLEAERAGKNRKGALEALQAARAA